MSTTRKFDSNIHISSKKSYGTDTSVTILPPNKKYTCKVSYPFSNGFTFKVSSNEKGLTLNGFVSKLSKAYKNHYKKIHEDKVDDGYWHEIGDLFLEETRINDTALTINVGIGS